MENIRNEIFSKYIYIAGTRARVLFYLNAFIVEKKEEGRHVHKDCPAIFRIDRIRSFRETGEKFQVSYADRIEVVRPESIRQEMKRKAEEILKLYS